MRKIALIAIGALFFVGICFVVLQTSKFYPILFQLLFNRDIELKKVENSVNILLLGTGGGEHDGPDLTDTIIFASISQKRNKVTLLSVPRDLWTPQLESKVNMTYAVGESKGKGEGIVLAETVVEKILGVAIDYLVRIDFDGFVEAVDVLGGIDVEVLNSFDDYEYPVAGRENDPCGQKEEYLEILATASSQLEVFPCRYTHIRFDKRKQHMNGDTALQFVRSRHAKGDEGTDFARSKRQEQVIKAVKEKVFSLNLLLNPAKVINLYNTLQESIDTNIKEDEFDDFVRLAQKLKTAKIQTAILDYGDKKTNRPGLLVNPPISVEYGNQWVLIPRVGNGNFSEIQKYVECEIKVGNCSIVDR